MPKKIDPKGKERCIQQMLEHVSEYPNPAAAAEAVANRDGVGTESVRRWYLQAQTDGGQRWGATSEELADIKELRDKVRRLEKDNDIASPGLDFLRVNPMRSVRRARSFLRCPGQSLVGLSARAARRW